MDINIAKEATQKKVLDELGKVSALTAIIAKGYELDSWGAYNEYVKAGQGKEIFEVGDTFTITYTATNGTEYDMDWVVAGFKDKVINGKTYKDVPILTTPYATLESMNFGEEEIMYYTEEGLPAGTYYFEVMEKYQGWNAGDTVQFTLEHEVPAGGQIGSDLKALDGGLCKIWTFSGPHSTTKIETVTAISGTSGTKLGEVYSGKINGQFNGLGRTWYGTGNYKESMQRQWANSDQLKEHWWTPANPWQRTENCVKNYNGFLCGLPNDFKSIVLPTTVVTAYDNTEAAERGETFYETQDMFWLLSKEEVHGTPNVANEHEGALLDYWEERTGLTAPSDAACNTRIVYQMDNHATACYVRLRSATRSSRFNTWCVYTSGQLGNGNGNSACRALLACQPLNPSI